MQFEELHNTLKKGDFIQSKVDPCLYMKIVKNKLIVYVDDFLLAAQDYI